MALAVTATGNHYLVDSLAGAAVALLALLVTALALAAPAPRSRHAAAPGGRAHRRA